MASKYEVASEGVVPAARAMIAKALVGQYKLKETQVAEYLDVTQAAISNYLNEKSKSIKKKIEEVEGKARGSKELVEGYVKNIAEGKKEYAGICICTICQCANRFNCAFSQARLANLASQ